VISDKNVQVQSDRFVIYTPAAPQGVGCLFDMISSVFASVL
jgi:hypothetical protein